MIGTRWRSGPPRLGPLLETHEPLEPPAFGHGPSLAPTPGGRPRVEAPRPAIRHTLGALLAFGALNAVAGGYYGLAGAKGVPTEWLEGSPFTDYFIPSLVLLVVVGGSFLLAAFAIFARRRRGRPLAFAAGAIVLGWLAVQLSILGYVSWMQPTTGIVAVVILALAWLLPID